MSRKEAKGGLWKTLWTALTLNGDFYENARSDATTNRLARTIVILAAISNALGTTVILLINLVTLPILVIAFVTNGLSVVLGYYFWTLTIWKIGQRLRRSSPSYQELLVPIGFAYAPQVLNFLTLIPLLGRPIQLVLAVWSLLAVIVAVRQGLDINANLSAFICLLGWPLVQIAIGFIQDLF